MGVGEEEGTPRTPFARSSAPRALRERLLTDSSNVHGSVSELLHIRRIARGGDPSRGSELDSSLISRHLLLSTALSLLQITT